MLLPHRPYVLIILDGWGYSDDPQGNAIMAAHKPNWDRLWAHYPHTLVSGSGLDVGLPCGQMGNSEVGHLNMGAGRLVPQDLVRINKAIEEGTFFTNPVLNDAVQRAVSSEHAVHILGLLSPGGVHSQQAHLEAMIRLAAKQGAKKIYLHAFLDGRDVAPKSALASIEKLEQLFTELGVGQIASLCGRYYAMDRDQRWDRVQLAYNLLTQGIAERHCNTAAEGLAAAYAAGETDEFVKPTVILPVITINDGDSVIFMNFRSDRARQLTHAFLDEKFSAFVRTKVPKLAEFVTLTEYAADIKAPIAFAPQSLHNVFGEYISSLGLTQLRIAETEKYAHVTFFFNGGREQPFSGEERILVPSQKVATYDLLPEMSAPLLTEKLVAAIESKKYDVIICNYANADMVGHSGNLPAAIEAIECIDSCLGKVVAALQGVGGECLITADHGNAERMFDPATHQPHTAHTSNPVPLLYVGRPAQFKTQHATLTDVIPTLLDIMGLEQPSEMTGHDLIEIKK
ncbi:MAG: 2,3-bisphosphoglycerate-independent phosphoglycerate mutase [Gammaproteobacteria bacterium]|nr:2,3-bisphosphoglycerate-independent phosphoglycerate mutase [Gammaproteobacteria bacterium]